MKKIIYPAIFSLCVLQSYAQKSISQRDELITDKAIFFTYEEGKLKYFKTGGIAGRESLKNVHSFALKGNFSNIYIGWKNPLRYQITWKDTTYADDRDKAVKDFIDLFVGQFGSPLADLKQSDAEAKSLVANISNSLLVDGKPKQNLSKTDSTRTRLYGINDKSFDGFDNVNLLNLYLQLRSNEGKLEESEIVQLNAVLKELDKLDNWNATDISGEVGNSFSELYKIEAPADVTNKLNSEKGNLSGWETTFKNIEKTQPNLANLNEGMQIASDHILQLYVTKVISSFLASVNDNLKNNKKIVAKIKPCYDILEKSVEKELKSEEGYYLNREIGFDDGKIREAEITITEYDLNKETKEFVKKSALYSSKLKFRKYDWVVPTVSSGIFHSTATLKGFGVSTDSSGKLKVSEDNIKKNTAVTGLFLNLNFDVGSRYFAPVLQIGIDPTKKRPYILVGTGFSIPFIRFSITGGPIWTWDARLEKLSTGEIIKSTTDLEKDIKYSIDINPKGWYLGLQYNF